MQDTKASQEDIAAYRLKIKKLKYKIELEEKAIAELKAQKSKLQIFQANSTVDAPSLTSILKKINFYISLKGLSLDDLFLACDLEAEELMQLEEYLQLLKSLGVRL